MEATKNKIDLTILRYQIGMAKLYLDQMKDGQRDYTADLQYNVDQIKDLFREQEV